MNYAEDRTDRRARMLGQDCDKGRDDVSETALEPDSRGSSSHGIVADLTQAHAMMRTALLASGQNESGPFSIKPRQGAGNTCTMRSLTILRDAHELAGRALRDCGLNRHSVFHYAMAFMCDPDSDKCAGDYATLCDLAGYPELGVISLLYYRAGGSLDSSVPLRLAQKEVGTEECDVNIFNIDPNSTTGCGCQHEMCGSCICHVAIPPTSPLLRTILESLELMGENCAHKGDAISDICHESETDLPTALELLSKVTKSRKGKKDNVSSHMTAPQSLYFDIGSQLLQVEQSILRFWDTSERVIAADPSDAPNEQSMAIHLRILPPLLQLLLLKVLFASPVGGPFLKLACEAIPHLAAAMPPSSDLARAMARDYKSHWAYYVLIRAVVLGERVKLHRRGTAVPYHVPVWDIVNALDQRKFDDLCADNGAPDSGRDEAFAQDLQQVIDICATILPPSSQQNCFLLRPRCLPRKTSHPPLFVLGDSHVLSIAWQTINIRRPKNSSRAILRTLVPFPATGLKAWHTRDGTRFFTHFNIRTCLERLPSSCKTIILSAGEIDCREGIGGKLLEGYYQNCDDAVRNTAQEYVRAVTNLAKEYGLQVLLLPVAPHAYRSQKNGKSTGRGFRRERMMVWNNVLREECQSGDNTDSKRTFLLDYERDLRSVDSTSPVGFVLNKAFNADYTHMNSAFLPHLERALNRSGCDIDLI